MSDKKKLTFADFPDEPHLNATDLSFRQAALDEQAASAPPPEAPAS